MSGRPGRERVFMGWMRSGSGVALPVLFVASFGSLSGCQDALPGEPPGNDAASVDGASGQGGGDAASDGASDGSIPGCYVGADCDGASEVCDPTTRECVPYQCNALIACPASMTCADQNPNAAGGACYPSCQPFEPGGGGCPAGQECRAGRIDGSIGLCFTPGTNPLGQPCVDSIVSTDCVPGLWCFKTSSSAFICAEPCDYWGDSKLCTGNLRCHPDLVCAPLSSALLVAIGEPCGGASNPLSACAADATHIRGLCAQETNGLVCRAMCRTALGNGDCTSGESCNPTPYNPILGFCQPA